MSSNQRDVGSLSAMPCSGKDLGYRLIILVSDAELAAVTAECSLPGRPVTATRERVLDSVAWRGSNRLDSGVLAAHFGRPTEIRALALVAIEQAFATRWPGC